MQTLKPGSDATQTFFSFSLSVNSPLPSRGQDGLFLPEPPPAEDPYFCFRVSGLVRVNVKA